MAKILTDNWHLYPPPPPPPSSRPSNTVQVVKRSGPVNNSNSPIQDYVQPDDHTHLLTSCVMYKVTFFKKVSS